MNATVRWTSGMGFSGVGAAGVAITMDAHPEHGGRDAGPSPMETVLLALGGCTGMDVVSILQKMRAPLAGLEIRIAAERADAHPKVFTRIALEYVFSGKALTPEQVSRAVELSQTRYCSVSAMLQKVTEFTYTWRIVP
ncbi:MAG TPA: OsmC family protein [bacterium]|nr:OsmC family protein [bacterium]